MALTDEDVFAYVQSAIPSVWALELLQTLYRHRDRSWRVADLIVELRSSESAVEPAIAALQVAGLIVAEGDAFRFHPVSDTVAQLVERTLELYAVRPAWIIRAVMSGPNEKLRIFANAFRLKD
jgi:hypothetical protein